VGAEAAVTASQRFGNLQNARCVVVGAGKTGTRAAKQLHKLGARDLVIINRTFDRAHELAKFVGGRAAPMEAIHIEAAMADVVIIATASQVPGTQRKAARQKKELMRFFLTACASVDELLNQVELLRRPVFYLAGDRKEIALIEVAPEGRRSVRRQDSGTLHHTNHYCILDPADLKRKPGASSTQRYARMSELLKGPPAPFAVEDFIRFSADAVAGPDNSIWRTESSPTHKRTLATWLVSVPTAGSPQLYLKTADPGEPEQVCRISVEAALGGGDRIPLTSELCR
jgi:hypothetical protein